MDSYQTAMSRILGCELKLAPLPISPCILALQHFSRTCFPSHILSPFQRFPHHLSSVVSPSFLFSLPWVPPPPPPPPPPPHSKPALDHYVKASQAVWSLSAGCQGRDTAHRDPEWDKLTVTMFPLSMWCWEKEKVKRTVRWLKVGFGGSDGWREQDERAGQLFEMYELNT